MERVPLTRFYGSTRARSRTRALKREGSRVRAGAGICNRSDGNGSCGAEARARRRRVKGGAAPPRFHVAQSHGVTSRSVVDRERCSSTAAA